MADRIGIITKGELILVEEKTKLMQKLGKRQLTLNLQEPMTALPGGAGAAGSWRSRPRATSWSTPSTRTPSSRTSRRCCAGWASWASASRT